MVVRGSAWRAAIWSRRSTPAASMVVTKVCRSMCGCIRGSRTPASLARVCSRRGGVPVHPGAAPGPQDGTCGALRDRLVKGSTDHRWEGGQDDLAALAGDSQYSVAVFLAEV